MLHRISYELMSPRGRPLKVNRHPYQVTPLLSCSPFFPSQCPSKNIKGAARQRHKHSDGVIRCEQALRSYHATILGSPVLPLGQYPHVVLPHVGPANRLQSLKLLEVKVQMFHSDLVHLLSGDAPSKFTQDPVRQSVLIAV